MQTLQTAHAGAFFPERAILNSDYNNYIITNPDDIRKKFNQLFKKNTLLAIKVPGKFVPSTLLTTISHIENNHIFLDGFQNERLNRDLLTQTTLAVSGNFEGIAVSFTLNNPSAYNINATLNIKASLPENIEWVQRRDARRVKVPMSIPVLIQYKGQTEYFNVNDISVSGLSYTYQLDNLRPAPIGKRYTDCNIVLPDKNVFQANLEITNSTIRPYKHNKQLNRVGCEIKRASYRLDTALQHLINQIDFYFQ